MTTRTTLNDERSGADVPPCVADCEARVRHFGEAHRAEVLRRSGHQLAAYASQRDAEIAALLREADRGEHGAAESFAKRFVAERKRLAEDDVPLEALGSLPVAAEPPVMLLEREPTPEPAIALGRSEPAPAASLDADPTRAVVHEVPSYLQDRKPDAIPAGPGAPAAAREPIPIEVSAPDPDSTLLPFARFEPVLPFEEPGRGAGGSRVDEPPTRAAAAPASPDHADAADATRVPPALGGADETAYLAPDVLSGPATPFDRDAAGELTLAAYARFLGSLAAAPDDAPVLRAKHGIADEDEQRAIGARFAIELDRDPSLRMRFEILVAQARTRAKRGA